MDVQQACPECEAVWQMGVTCLDHFHQMLFWENEDPQRGAVHHLMVLGYHLQHPSLYAPDGLEYSLQLLADFVEHGVSPQQVRKQRRSAVDSGKRKWKIRARTGLHGAYRRPVRWSMTAQDVVNAGAEHYIESVQQWVRAILADLRLSGNLE